jgi:hypothetical protein
VYLNLQKSGGGIIAEGDIEERLIMCLKSGRFVEYSADTKIFIQNLFQKNNNCKKSLFFALISAHPQYKFFN